MPDHLGGDMRRVKDDNKEEKIQSESFRRLVYCKWLDGL